MLPSALCQQRCLHLAEYRHMLKPLDDTSLGDHLLPAPREWARQLRRDQTDAERRLWQRLRSGQLGVKFRRQHPLAGYILDFCCVSRRLVVELDGCQHREPEAVRRDFRRDEALRSLGFRVLRFTNRQALLETSAVVAAIGKLLTPSPCPLPPGEETGEDALWREDPLSLTVPHLTDPDG